MAVKAIEGELVRPYTFGRPSKLTVELLTRAREYVEQSDNMSATTLLPTKERLARVLGITRETLYKWCNENTDFSDICHDLDLIQADKAMQNGLMNRYNSSITAIVLSRHGYVRKEETESTETVTHKYEQLEDKDIDARLNQVIESGQD